MRWQKREMWSFILHLQCFGQIFNKHSNDDDEKKELWNVSSGQTRLVDLPSGATPTLPPLCLMKVAPCHHPCHCHCHPLVHCTSQYHTPCCPTQAATSIVDWAATLVLPLQSAVHPATATAIPWCIIPHLPNPGCHPVPPLPP